MGGWPGEHLPEEDGDAYTETLMSLSVILWKMRVHRRLLEHIGDMEWSLGKKLCGQNGRYAGEREGHRHKSWIVFKVVLMSEETSSEQGLVQHHSRGTGTVLRRPSHFLAGSRGDLKWGLVRQRTNTHVVSSLLLAKHMPPLTGNEDPH